MIRGIDLLTLIPRRSYWMSLGSEAGNESVQLLSMILTVNRRHAFTTEVSIERRVDQVTSLIKEATNIAIHRRE